MRTAFDEGAQQLFADHSILAGFSWRQYTPYFNDGEACEFSVHSRYPSVWYTDAEIDDDKLEELRDEGEIDFYKSDRNDQADPKIIAGNAVVDFLTAFNEGLMKSAFGEHAQVTCKRDCAIDAEHYDHD